MYKNYEDVTTYSVLLLNAVPWIFVLIFLFTIIDPDFFLVKVQDDVAMYVITLSFSMIRVYWLAESDKPMKDYGKYGATIFTSQSC